MRLMPNLLFIAHPFPPAPFSGANRTWPLAKNLSRLGWNVTVVSARDHAYSRRAASKAIADLCRAEGLKLITVGSGTWAPDDAESRLPHIERLKSNGRRYTQGLLRRVIRMCDSDLWCVRCGVGLILRPRPTPDVILATGKPFGSFVLARTLSSYFGVPYVLDYRDPWSANPYRGSATSRLALALETWSLARASATVMVSRSQAEAQKQYFPQFAQPEIVTNGYDHELLDSIEGHTCDKCVIVYAGILYPGKRDLDPVLAAIARVGAQPCRALRPIELHYFGPQSDLVRHAANVHGAGESVVLHSLVSRTEVLKAVKSADAAVVITGMNDEAPLAERGIMTGKIFEALGLGTPVLLISPRNSDARQLLVDTNNGAAYCASQIDDITQWLVDLTSRPRPPRTPATICSWVTLAEKFDRILRAVVKSPSASV